MPAWNDLLDQLHDRLRHEGEQAAGQWMQAQQVAALQAIGTLRGGTNVISYGSGFLQKPQAPQTHLQIVHEDLNGFMSVLYGMDWSKGATLLLHTPGGSVNAAESLVAYLRSKFDYLEVVVPALAMSAGTMISLAANKVLMGRQSQLGPIDPQMGYGGQSISARAVVDQFTRGRTEVLADVTTAHVWAPILQSAGPSLLVEAENALAYGESMVADWLKKYMFASATNPEGDGKRVAEYFNAANMHKSHGRRIDANEAKSQGVAVELLEQSQELQESVLTSYHIMTLGFENGTAAKSIITDSGRAWAKNWVSPQDLQLQQQMQQVQQQVQAPGSPSSPRPNRADRRRAQRGQ